MFTYLSRMNHQVEAWFLEAPVGQLVDVGVIATADIEVMYW